MEMFNEAINFFEYLASNAHHQIEMDELINKRSSMFKKVYLLNNSEKLKRHFSKIEYLADSIKVTEI